MIDMAFLRRRAAVDYLEVSQLRGWKEGVQDKIAEIGEESAKDGEQSVLFTGLRFVRQTVLSPPLPSLRHLPRLFFHVLLPSPHPNLTLFVIFPALGFPHPHNRPPIHSSPPNQRNPSYARYPLQSGATNGPTALSFLHHRDNMSATTSVSNRLII